MTRGSSFCLVPRDSGVPRLCALRALRSGNGTPFANGPRAMRIFLAIATVCATACGLPRDADGTLDRVRNGTLRVGVAVDTPWVTDSGGAAGGVEGWLAV